MAEIGQTGFFIEGPHNRYGNRNYAPAVIEGRAVPGPISGLVKIEVDAPPEFVEMWDSVHNGHDWVQTEGPARMLDRDEWAQLTSHIPRPDNE